MLSIPLYVFLFLYLIAFVVFLGVALIDTYHVVAAGEFTFISFSMTIAIFVVGIGIFLTTWYILSAAHIDWNARLVLFNLSWIPGIGAPQTF